MDYPLISGEATIEGVRLDPVKLAQQLLPIVDAFNKVVEAKPGKFQLDSFDLGLSISGEGSIGFVTIGAEASLNLHFTKP